MSSDDEAKDARLEELEWQVLEWQGRARRAEEQLAHAALRIRVLEDESRLRLEGMKNRDRRIARITAALAPIEASLPDGNADYVSLPIAFVRALAEAARA